MRSAANWLLLVATALAPVLPVQARDLVTVRLEPRAR